MDTKWKDRIVIVGLLVLISFGLSGFVTAIFNEKDYLEPNYFKTSQFERTIQDYTKYINAFDISYQSIEEMKQNIVVSQQEMEEYRSRYGVNLAGQIVSIEQEYSYKIEEAKTNNNPKIEKLYVKERDEKIEEITKVFEDDEYVKSILKNEKEEKINQYFNELEQFKGTYETYEDAFVYYLKNTNTGEVFTNVLTQPISKAEDLINEKTMHYVQSYPNKDNHLLNLDSELLVWGYQEVIGDNTRYNDLYEGKIGVSKNAPVTNMVMLDYHSYGNERITFWIYTLGSLIALVASVYIGRRTGSLSKIAPKKWQSAYNKLPFDIAIILLGLSIIISLGIISGTSHLYYRFQVDDFLLMMFWLSIFIGITIIQAIYFNTRVKSISSNDGNWRNTVLARTIKMFSNAFSNRKVSTQIFLILTVYFLFGLGFGLSAIEEEVLVLVLPALFIIGLPLFILIVKKIGYFNKILTNAKALADGRFEPDLNAKGKSPLADLARTINAMKYGVKISQNEQAKSERLKTELITNVSHDLRTPLTSIITYTELLKNVNLTEDERTSYVEIIDRKSKRLKVLIDDLFEASKMASGAIELTRSKVNIVELFHQSLAEYQEEIQEMNMQFRITKPDNPVYTYVDGQKISRVFENLLGNIIKYSLENTRAYITINEEEDQVKITFKNVTKYELSENIDELFERFKRGDESRHTEGSGLGLAIAKSIIDLHDGSLDIEVDGDLFKVTVILAKVGK
ncbi:GHKL domain-containing protein [Cytobacillus suaedae]|nr:GHKL domain-containing protein [Cytobacillus suaedae]